MMRLAIAILVLLAGNSLTQSTTIFAFFAFIDSKLTNTNYKRWRSENCYFEYAQQFADTVAYVECPRLTALIIT